MSLSRDTRITFCKSLEPFVTANDIAGIIAPFNPANGDIEDKTFYLRNSEGYCDKLGYYISRGIYKAGNNKALHWSGSAIGERTPFTDIEINDLNNKTLVFSEKTITINDKFIKEGNVICIGPADAPFNEPASRSWFRWGGKRGGKKGRKTVLKKRRRSKRKTTRRA